MQNSRAAFDPLSYENLGLSIVDALERQPIEQLKSVHKFKGAGIYALYYTGNFDLYAPVAEANRKQPGSWALYIGKADAENSRKGLAVSPEEVGYKLYNRIKNHRRSIEQVANLDIADFTVRLLVLTPTWVPLAEQIAIRTHSPLWNTHIDGLGNHDPGSGRSGSQRSKWDTIHPGRPWADKLHNNSIPPEDLAKSAYSSIEERLKKLNNNG